MAEHTEQPSTESPMDQRERRLEYRLNQVLEAEFCRGEDRRQMRLFVNDISLSGMRATTAASLSQDEEHDVRLALSPEAPPVEVKARVAWQRPVGGDEGMQEVGLAFTFLPADMAQRLDDFIERERHKEAYGVEPDAPSIWGLLTRPFR